MKRILLILPFLIIATICNAQWKIYGNQLITSCEVDKLGDSNNNYTSFIRLNNIEKTTILVELIIKDSLNNIDVFHNEVSISSRLTKDIKGVLNSVKSNDCIELNSSETFSLNDFVNVLSAQPCIATIITNDGNIYDISIPSGNFTEKFSEFSEQIRAKQVNEWIIDGNKLTLFTEAVEYDYFKNQTMMNATISIAKDPIKEYVIIITFLDENGVKKELGKHIESYSSNFVGVSDGNISFSAIVRNNSVYLTTPQKKVLKVIESIKNGNSFFITLLGSRTGYAFTAIIPSNTDFNEKLSEFNKIK